MESGELAQILSDRRNQLREAAQDDIHKEYQLARSQVEGLSFETVKIQLKPYTLYALYPHIQRLHELRSRNATERLTREEEGEMDQILSQFGPEDRNTERWLHKLWDQVSERYVVEGIWNEHVTAIHSLAIERGLQLQDDSPAGSQSDTYQTINIRTAQDSAAWARRVAILAFPNALNTPPLQHMTSASGWMFLM